MKNKIALKLLAFFAAALLTFSLIIGIMFRSLFTEAVLSNKKTEMLTKAQSLSKTLQDMLESPGQGGGPGMGNQGMNYTAFVRAISQANENIWVLDEKMAFLSGGTMRGRKLSYENLPPDADQLVLAVFRGETPYSEGFSELLGAPTLTVGVPIYAQGRVRGALLLHDAVSGITEATRQGQNILLLSGAVALVLAAVPSVLLAFSFTKPIRRIQAVAGRLSEGDYEARTGVEQEDEIGQLAQSVDALACDLKEARDEKERQEQRRNDFLASISHELRTPVTVIKTSLEALKDGVVAEPEQVREYHEQMLRDARGLQVLVNDLMELARLQNADFPIEKSELILNDVLSDALRSASRLAEKKDIRIKREVLDRPLPFTGDYARLRQMLLIVMDNAVKFSKPGSEITVKMDENSIEVRDRGSGISKEELKHLFDRFRKSRTEENREGSGLGLAIAREIASRHGIRLHVESAEGEGTAVRFMLKK
ncbi:MAG: HAMP domain-containing sensor histidine kinase [Bacillota bacterium]|nr:HAMP domain-containing sensor histidine kinase [Bacillota bacterium]